MVSNSSMYSWILFNEYAMFSSTGKHVNILHQLVDVGPDLAQFQYSLIVCFGRELAIDARVSYKRRNRLPILFGSPYQDVFFILGKAQQYSFRL